MNEIFIFWCPPSEYLKSEITMNSLTYHLLAHSIKPPKSFLAFSQNRTSNSKLDLCMNKPEVFPENFQTVLECKLVMSPAVDQISDLCLCGCLSALQDQRYHGFPHFFCYCYSPLVVLRKIPANYYLIERQAYIQYIQHNTINQFTSFTVLICKCCTPIHESTFCLKPWTHEAHRHAGAKTQTSHRF